MKVEDKKSSNISSTVPYFFSCLPKYGVRAAIIFFFGRGNANRKVATCSCKILCICQKSQYFHLVLSANQVKYLLRKWLSILFENGSQKFDYVSQ